MNIPKHVTQTGNLLLGLLLSSSRPCNIATFHLGRSGSRLLGDLLMQHPKIVWQGELLSPGRLNALAERRPLLARKPMGYLKFRLLMAGMRCYGFETQPTQIQQLEMGLEEYADRLEKLGFSHFVLLERKNHLRRIVSMLVGRSTSVWHLEPGDTSTLARVEIDVDQLLLGRGVDTKRRSLVEHLQREQESLSELKQVLGGRRLLCLTYEDDLAASPEETYRRVCDFAGLGYHQVTVRLGKTNPFELRDILTNFSDVERVLRGTSFEWMLYS
ncbi:MAG: hypothetical protein WCH04_12445 [Gammaproteobacteria bacterium]